MKLRLFKSKIHRATVTHADLDYEGSVTVDRDLMDRAHILPFEEVHIWNVTRGTRLSTYALEGPRGSGAVCINGAAAHLNQPGDLVILATFAEMTPEEARAHVPVVVRVDASNAPIDDDAPEQPGPILRSVGEAPQRPSSAPESPTLAQPALAQPAAPLSVTPGPGGHRVTGVV